jgi:ribonuclease J
MNDKKTDHLDKWLQKNVTPNSSGNPPEPEKKSFFNKFKSKPKPDAVKPAQQPKREHNNSQERTNSRPNPNAKPFKKPNSVYHNKVRFIPLGGLNEVGKNMMAIEYGNDIIVVDMGLEFPSEDMLGVDYIVPDITYLKENLHKIRGILITHGHLDHIGGISYIAPKLNNPPFFGLRLTTGFIQKQIREHPSCKSIKLVTVKPKQKFKLGVFTIQFYRVNHSIPDSTGIIIETPEGLVVHTGDFKFDETPADGMLADMETLKWLGTQNVLALFSDSTNSGKPGKAMSEKIVGQVLDDIVGNTKGRVIIASFSSLIGRVGQLLVTAQKYNRKVFVSGRSMVDNVEIATKLGYLKYSKDLVKPLNRSKKDAQQDNALILTTGSQGEPMSALTRMANNEHKQIKINERDTIILSSNPIIGNERGIIAVINELSKKGARIISNQIMDVHTTGHGYQDDLKLMLKLVNPKYLIPVHGEYYMRKAHKELAISEGFNKDNIILLENGSVLEAKDKILTVSKEVVPSNYILVDNQSGGLSDISYNIISERQAMAGNGVIVLNVSYSKKFKKVSKIDIQSHGFIYMKETKKVLEEMQKTLLSRIEKYIERNGAKMTSEDLQLEFKTSGLRFITEKIERRPVISVYINQY